MSILVTKDWHEIGSGSSSQFFRRSELYTMGWTAHVDLDNFALVGGSYGGLLAIIRDDKKLTRVTANVPVKPIISLYNPAGSLLASIRWDSGILIRMGWSTSEDLLCIQEDGNVLVYSMFGILSETFHCLTGTTDSKEKAYEAEIFPCNSNGGSSGTAICILTTLDAFIILDNYKFPKTRRYPTIPGEGPIRAWAVINANNQTKVIASKDSGLFVVEMNDCFQVTPEFLSPAAGFNSPVFVYMCVSLNGEHVALYSDTGVLWLGSSNLKRRYCDISTGVQTRPKQIVWCGNEAVILSWEHIPSFLLVNLNGEKLPFPMDSKFYLIPEIDSTRIVSNFLHEIVQKVPEDTRLIFGIGSVAPGSWLLEASKEYSQKSHKADDYIRCIGNIEQAVQQCIDAAGYEFQPSHQKMLLKAAQFGKCFLTKYNPENYVRMCQMLRILNSMKDYRIAVPLTFPQLEHLTVTVLIDRLVFRRQYSLAIKIAEFMRIPGSLGKSRILAHWACFKVSQIQGEENVLASEIHAKLKSDPSVSYSEIANKAIDAGRKRLALNLAHYELRRSVQVPLFLKLGDNKTALQHAVESGDSNLVYDVLFKLRDSMDKSQFQMLIRNYPVAQNLYTKYCQDFLPEAARSVYEIEDDFAAQGALCIHESYKEKRLESRMSSLQTAQQFYTRAKNEFMASACEEQTKLLKHQQSLEQQYGKPFLNLSLRETIQSLLVSKELKIAEKLRAEYKVSDRMFWLIRIATLGEGHEWTELEKLSKTKKMPGGFEDFVDVCLQFGNRTEAFKYLPKVKDDVQVRLYVDAGYFEEAARIALAQKDSNALQYVYAKCLTVDRDVAAKVKDIMDELKATGDTAGPVPRQ